MRADGGWSQARRVGATAFDMVVQHSEQSVMVPSVGKNKKHTCIQLFHFAEGVGSSLFQSAINSQRTPLSLVPCETQSQRSNFHMRSRARVKRIKERALR
jgi:hypothetical protein